MEAHDYGDLAHYYDPAYASKTDLCDVGFYVKQAQKYGGPVLEIACGTGRVLLEIAKLDIEITGVDFCENFLEILRRKNTGKNVSLHHADMRDFSLDKKFSLVTIPFRPLQHMYTFEDQVKALTCARNHMADDGVLIFDVFYPRWDRLFEGLNQERFELEWQDTENPQRMVRRSFLRKEVNAFYQFFSGEFIFRTYENDKVVKEERSKLKMSFYTYPQMQALLQCCGLKIIEQYGSFNETPIADGPDMIFVVKKA